MMAKILGNKFPFGPVTGKIGNVIIRRRGKMYYVTSLPVKRKAPSPKQLAHRKKFAKAIEYGKMATRPGSPFLEVYEGLARNKYKSPMNMAVADWFQEPKIENVDLSRYHGLVGDVIFIRAGKVRGPIAGVEVVVLDQEGCEVERGNAVQDPMLADEWSYTATSAVVTRKAKVMVTVKDLPGNTDEDRLEKKLEDN